MCTCAYDRATFLDRKEDFIYAVVREQVAAKHSFTPPGLFSRLHASFNVGASKYTKVTMEQSATSEKLQLVLLIKMSLCLPFYLEK